MIIAQFTYENKDIPVKITEKYTSTQGVKWVVIETLDGSTPFWTIGSKISKFTAWTNATADKLTEIKCAHEHTEVDFTGSMHFSPEIGPWDDIEEHLYCLDCGKEIYPPVRIPSTQDDFSF